MIEMLFLLLEDLRLYPTAFDWMGGKGELLFGYYILSSICALVVPSWEVLFLDEGLLLGYYTPCAQQSASWCHHFWHYC